MKPVKVSSASLVAGGCSLACSASAALAQFESLWRAGWGRTPDQVSQPWVLTDTASPENPVLSPQSLTLSTSHNSESMFYRQGAATVDTSRAFFMEFGTRLVSGSSSSSARAPIMVHFVTAPGVGGSLFIGVDDVFFTRGNLVRGNSAGVDTNGSIHVYRIDVAATGALTLSYDGSPLLTGHTFADGQANGGEARIVWGEGSGLAAGTSEWTFFRHNALIAPSCYPDCDISSGPGVLDIFDFLCFQNSFAALDPYACDCDTASGPLVCDIFDFLCFQNAFAAGCP